VKSPPVVGAPVVKSPPEVDDAVDPPVMKSPVVDAPVDDPVGASVVKSPTVVDPPVVVWASEFVVVV